MTGGQPTILPSSRLRRLILALGVSGPITFSPHRSSEASQPGTPTRFARRLSIKDCL